MGLIIENNTFHCSITSSASSVPEFPVVVSCYHQLKDVLLDSVCPVSPGQMLL